MYIAPALIDDSSNLSALDPLSSPSPPLPFQRECWPWRSVFLLSVLISWGTLASLLLFLCLVLLSHII